MARAGWTHDELVTGVLAGDRRALARAITLVEDGSPEAETLVREVYPRTGRAASIGVTGPPGVGMSRLVSALVAEVRGAGRAPSSCPASRTGRRDDDPHPTRIGASTSPTITVRALLEIASPCHPVGGDGPPDAVGPTIRRGHFPAHGARIPASRDDRDGGPDRPWGWAGLDTRIAGMPEISREEVAHLATLARIDLSDAELDHLAPQLSVILESVASITGVAGDDVPPTSHAIPLTNVFREDVVVPGLSAEEALSGAPAVEEQRFSVPRILEEEA